jgi:hypothetical protein
MPAIPIDLLVAFSCRVDGIVINPIDATAKGCCGPPQVNTALVGAAIRWTEKYRGPAAFLI